MNKIFKIWDKFASFVCSFMSESEAHLLFGTLISLIVTLFAPIIFNNAASKIYYLFGIIASALVGLLKETIDYFRGEKFDYKDLLFSVLGGVIGSFIGFIILLLKQVN